jgi:1,4-alpha-glucan branching enzyme
MHKGATVIKQAPVNGRKAVKVSFILRKDTVPGHVSVVGDFNGWDPLAHPLRPRANGTRSAAVTLPRGRRYAFRYLAEDGRWHDDESAETFEPNGVGGHNAVIHT